MRMNNKKGQAAMEFLMTYGWAILAAIVVIAVLAIYFRPSTLVSGSTFVTAPFYAVASAVNTTDVQLEIKNNGGETYETTAFNITITSPTGEVCTNENIGVGSLAAGATQVLTVNGCSLTAGASFNADIVITYLKTGATLEQKSTGSMSGSVSA
jgi:uncharacterized protein (UPF0333 family)